MESARHAGASSIGTDTLNLTASGQARARFLQEARTLSRVRHPNLVDVYDYGQCEEVLWIALELIQGETWEQVFTASARGLSAAGSMRSGTTAMAADSRTTQRAGPTASYAASAS